MGKIIGIDLGTTNSFAREYIHFSPRTFPNKI